MLALGGGTNLLVADAGFPGLVVRCGIARLERRAGSDGGGRCGPGARAPLAAVARGTARRAGRASSGPRGSPGPIGGAVVGNAGAFGGEIAGVVPQRRVLLPRLRETGR